MKDTEKREWGGIHRFLMGATLSTFVLLMGSVGISPFRENISGIDDLFRMVQSTYPSISFVYSILLLILLMHRGIRHRDFTIDRWEWLLLAFVLCSAVVLRALTRENL